MRTWIKFCGTTSLEDALASVEAGANALGFIFAPSKRRITVEKAQQIIPGLPASVERIGVFMNGSVEEVRDVVTNVDLTGIQLHGNELAPEVFSYLPKDRRNSLRIIKTVVMQGSFEWRVDPLTTVPGVVDAWLLDTGAGSGRTFDLQAGRAELADRPGRFIIAGGLTPENGGDAIQLLSPWGADVVSGVVSEARG